MRSKQWLFFTFVLVLSLAFCFFIEYQTFALLFEYRAQQETALGLVGGLKNELQQLNLRSDAISETLHTFDDEAQEIRRLKEQKAAALKKELARIDPVTVTDVDVFNYFDPPYEGYRVRPNEKPVDDSYFDDALFIGNSQVQGQALFSRFKKATYYCLPSVTAFSILDTPLPNEFGVPQLLSESLRDKSFKKIYILLGINEISYDDLPFYLEAYDRLIRELKTLQPDAVIYIQSVLPVARSRTEREPEFNNRAVSRMNRGLYLVAKKTGVNYLHVNQAYADQEGGLPEGLAEDGVHLLPNAMEPWDRYLLNHTAENNPEAQAIQYQEP